MSVRIAALAALAALATASVANAEEETSAWFHETVKLDAGATFAFFDTRFSVSGFPFDLEEDIGFDPFDVVPGADAHWRFSENGKHRLELSYFAIFRDGGDRTAVELGPVNGQPVTVAASVDGDLKVHVLSATYAYSFLHDARKELGILAGLDYIIFEASGRGRVTIPELGIDRTDELLSESYATPFPTAGAYLDWALCDDLAFASRFQYFGVKVGGVGGEIFRGNVKLKHRTFRNLHLYAGYELLDASVDVGSDTFGDVDLFYHGPRVGLEIVF